MGFWRTISKLLTQQSKQTCFSNTVLPNYFFTMSTQGCCSLFSHENFLYCPNALVEYQIEMHFNGFLMMYIEAKQNFVVVMSSDLSHLHNERVKQCVRTYFCHPQPFCRQIGCFDHAQHADENRSKANRNSIVIAATLLHTVLPFRFYVK